MSEPDGEALLRMLSRLDRFEDAWKRGAPIPLEECLREADGADRSWLIHQALGLELRYRGRRGENPTPEEYLARFPDDARLIRDAFEATTVSFPPATDTGSNALDPAIIGPSAGGGGMAPAERIGKFLVIRRLGTGGQASALLARDPDFGRLVVLKLYHTSARDAHLEGALQDGKALVRLRSRCTPHCYGLERQGDDLVLVMEYIPGRNLSEIIKAGLPTPEAAARLVEEVSEGVEAVHACGLVHRDIKPANIVVGDDGAPRLVDFGLAAHLGSEALKGICGTPQYMAPEQARGQWERIDGRTDVYGLGAVLYSLLTGLPPHPGTALPEVLEHARQGAVAPPRELKPSIPRALERIALKALEADPDRRYSSATELRQALLRARLGKNRRRAAAGVAVLIIGLALLAVASAWSGVGWPLRRQADGPVRVTALTVERFLDRGAGQPPQSYGFLGDRSFEAAEGDFVRVSATLNRPAYCFLVALNPDGTIQLCYPPGNENTPDETVAPPRTDRIEYPARSSRYYSLTDGRGQQAFVLFAAQGPLPPFNEWRARLDGAPWLDRARSGASGGVWDFDDREVHPVLPPTVRLRGNEVERAPAGLAELHSFFRASAKGATFRGLAFPVR